MIHHVSLGTNDVACSRAFYYAVFAILGIRLLSSDAESADYGVGSFAFSLETPVDGKSASPGNGVHIAFAARRRAMVEQFYKVAPGLRLEYDAHYFGAFVHDPDGNKIGPSPTRPSEDFSGTRACRTAGT